MPFSGRGESFTHFLARESQFFLEVMIVISLIAIVITMITFFFFVFIPVFVLLLSYGLLVLANAIERRTSPVPSLEAEAVPEALAAVGEEERERTDEARRFRRGWRIKSEAALRRRLSRVALEIVIGAAVIAIIFAFLALPREVVILGIGVLFCYILFITAPVWLAWLNDETGEEERRQAAWRE